MAPSHYLNQCWPIIKSVLWHSSDCNHSQNAHKIIEIHLKTTHFILQSHLLVLMNKHTRQIVYFYTPFEKRTYYAVAMSIRPRRKQQYGENLPTRIKTEPIKRTRMMTKQQTLTWKNKLKMPALKLRHMTKEMLSSLKLLITLTFLVISLPNQHMEFSHPKSFVTLGSAVRKVICLKGLRASPKNYYRNTTPSMASSHHWRNVWRNIAGSRPNWAQDFTRTSQKNSRTSQKNYYQHSRNFWNFLFLLIIPTTQASRCTTGWSDSGCWGADTS